MKHLLIMVVSTFLGVACYTPPPQVAHTVPFATRDFEWAAASGNGRVEGQAFVTDDNGRVVYAAGKEIVLIPRNAYTDEWIERAVRGHERLIPAAQQQAYERKAVADAEGRFSFSALPPGSYYLYTFISWQVRVRDCLTTDTLFKGGEAYLPITVTADSPGKVVLTGPLTLRPNSTGPCSEILR